jgi:hypothetical protein
VRRRLLSVVLAAVALAALPVAALAQPPGNAFTPGIPQQQATIPTTAAPTTPAPATPSTTGTTSSGGGGLTGTGVIAIAIGAIVVLGGISYFIWWDARKRAPIRHRAAAATAGTGPRSGSKPRAKPRKLSPAERRRRKRGKAR